MPRRDGAGDIVQHAEETAQAHRGHAEGWKAKAGSIIENLKFQAAAAAVCIGIAAGVAVAAHFWFGATMTALAVLVGAGFLYAAYQGISVMLAHKNASQNEKEAQRHDRRAQMARILDRHLRS